MTGRIFCGGCRKASPVFVAREIRCRFGHAAVQVCRPWGRKPFPTSFWLVCPYLVRLAGKIESMGGVHELEEYIVSNNLVREWRRYNMMHQAVRLRLGGMMENWYMRRYRRGIFRDVMRGGVGGIRVGEGVNVKCLHLQTASFIGTGHHPAEYWLKDKGLCNECGCDLCGKG